MYDVIIIGAGPAGLTAALYSARRELKTLVISKDLGGQAVLTDKIYNYPGIKFMAGVPMMNTFKEQAEEYGAEFLFKDVVGVEKTEKGFTVKTTQETFEAKSVILCFGLTPRDMDLENEAKFKGISINSEVMSHADQFKDKIVAVVGGGNSALEAVEYLSPLVNKVHLIHRRDTFRAEEVTVKKVMALNNVNFVLDSTVEAIIGEDSLKGLTVKNAKTDASTDITCDGVFVKIGYRAFSSWLGDLVETTDRGHIKVSKDCETGTDGLFAAGDCTDVPYKQIITSGGEGCKAAIKAYEYIMAKDGKRAILFDWT